mmetsp:Transcript_39663/g.126749  ORF Transcript_39663/g.126749 Transcript_39663/m.126749 type:complete len:122 (-) Transcript_39663:868-1233(-)
MPPPGGFPGIRYARRMGNTGPNGITIFAVGAAVMAYGFYKVGQTNIERRKVKQEKYQARLNIIPVLQAEEDARYVAEKAIRDAQEAEIMKDVPGWEVGKNVYSSRWMPPGISTRPGYNKTA